MVGDHLMADSHGGGAVPLFSPLLLFHGFSSAPIPRLGLFANCWPGRKLAWYKQ